MLSSFMHIIRFKNVVEAISKGGQTESHILRVITEGVHHDQWCVVYFYNRLKVICATSKHLERDKC